MSSKKKKIKESKESNDIDNDKITMQYSGITTIPIVEKKNDFLELHGTNRFLSKFERAKTIGIRAEQLAFGAPPQVEVPPDMSDPQEIAKLELKQKRMPLIIRRELPGGIEVDIKVNDLL